jgi:CHAT domain-containing protein
MADVTLKVRGRRLPSTASPALFKSATRGSPDAEDNPFLPRDFVTVEEAIDLSIASRSTDAGSEPHDVEGTRGEVVILEMADGVTVITSPETLAETIARIDPSAIDAEGKLVLQGALATRSATVRGGLADGIEGLVNRFFKLTIGKVSDPILDAAKQKLAEWIGGKVAQKLGEIPGLGVTWLGTKALMWAIEQRLDRPPGLYRWAHGQATDAFGPSDPRLDSEAQKGPLLVFVHGTASNTEGSFRDLHAGSGAYWKELEDRYDDRIYAFEHRTLSESPIENALELARRLPRNARVHLVTHSRGGLVGDLLCLDPTDELLALFRGYAIEDAIVGAESTEERERVVAELKAAHGEQRTKLVDLHAVLRARQIRVERYVRVACPARGTRLASGNFDVFLSGLLSLIGLIPAFQGNPIYWAFKRAVLEIAKHRTKPQLVPGIEAMLPESPMARLLAHAKARAETKVGVIAGDAEGEGVLAKLAFFFTDFMFDRRDNDLVVDTDSMSAGIARAQNARVLFDQGQRVNHFRYFDNAETRAGLRAWLLAGDVDEIAGFAAWRDLSQERTARDLAARRGRTRGAAKDDMRPVALVLPGIMGSHLQVGTDRVWISPTDLFAGGLDKIRWGKPNVSAERLFDLFYGDLCDHLSHSHRVETFAYDWRSPIPDLAKRFGKRLSALLDETESPARPVRIVAHSMGGLVVRALVHTDRPLWDRLMRRRDARFVMLGTPNQGSFAMVEALIGKSAMIRALALTDVTRDLGSVLEIIGSFPGALQLLPKPGFADTGFPRDRDFFDAAKWSELKSEMNDGWFGERVCAEPRADLLAKGRWLWAEDGARASLPAEHEDKVLYVHGCAPKTPCGLKREGARWKMVATAKGDGTVTWDSGRIAGIKHRFWMQAEHGDLARTEEHFDAIVELLVQGKTDALASREPVMRSTDVVEHVTYDAGPPVPPTEIEAAGALMGGARPVRKKSKKRAALKVRVIAMDLRGVTSPLLVGHYDEDPISGAEAITDRYLVQGELARRHNLGDYPGRVGTALAVLRARNELERARGSFGGAIVTGLGKYDGSLTVGELTVAARTAGLRYLLQVKDHVDANAAETHLTELRVSSLLLGYQSSAQFTVADSVGAVIRGIVDANAKFEEEHASLDEPGAKLRIGAIDFVELYLDTAISATYAVRKIASMSSSDSRSAISLEASPTLEQREGCRPRLEASLTASYWPRLIVTDAARREDDCPPECMNGSHDSKSEPSSIAIAETLKFLHLGARARAETTVEQRQPGLIEKMVASQISVSQPVFSPDFSRALFQLIVPHDFKDAARQMDRVVLVLDRYTANLPWELMLADDKPLAVTTAMVRQLSSRRFRARVTQTTARTALVVGNPSSDGFEKEFPPESGDGVLPDLPDAEAEANAVANSLQGHGFEVERATGKDAIALDVIGRLYKRPYRLLHIAAHGVFEQRAADGRMRSGVVLSGGALITAAEIAAMETVPDLVFLSCCHLGKIDSGTRREVAYNKLASSVSRELIEIGVRVVVAAGWPVNDDAAAAFTNTFYTSLLDDKVSFGEAILAARRETWAKFSSGLTWGAFQAYGDPEWRLEAGRRRLETREPEFAAPDELLAAIAEIRSNLRRMGEAPRESEARREHRNVQRLIERADPCWLARPDVSSQLGELYGDLGPDYFATACEYYEKAIKAGDRLGTAPIRAIEQLANLEARTAERKQDVEMAKRAIARIEGLGKLLARTAKRPKDASPPNLNVERAAILGSAYKSLAAIYARRLETPRSSKKAGEPAAADHAAFDRALTSAAAAYELYASNLASKEIDPYPTLNRLALSALSKRDAKQRAADVELARRCIGAADARFAASPDFWNAVTVADAFVVEALLDQSLAEPDPEGAAALDRIENAYRTAIRSVLVRPKDLDSVARQIELLALFFGARPKGWKEAHRMAARLRELGVRLQRAGHARAKE